MGEDTTFIAEAMIGFLCFAVCVVYTRLLGDIFTPMVAHSGMAIPSQYKSRVFNIIMLVVTCLLPMSLLRNMGSLALTSGLGLCAVAYTVFFMLVRSMDGTYTLGSGKYATHKIPIMLPQFRKSSWLGFDLSSLVLASNLGLAYMAHYNAPTFYRKLQRTSPQRYSRMLNTSFTVLVMLYALTMIAGYSTFGDVCKTNILLNYHPADRLATLGRLANGFSILFGFPLVANGCREALLGAASSLNWISYNDYDKFSAPLVIAILFFTTLAACIIPDLSVMIGLTGAVMGSFIVYLAPSLLYRRAVHMTEGKVSMKYRAAYMRAVLYIPLGILVCVMGVYTTLREAMNSKPIRVQSIKMP
jgi:amino acid permease